MKRYRCSFIFLAVVLGILPGEAAAECTPPLLAPGHFPNPSQAWNGTDTGVVVDRFVGLLDEHGQPLELIHGTDLSSNNTVDYQVISGCGGSFAFVRVDDQADQHARGLLARNVSVLPYVYFPIPKDLRNAAPYSTVDRDEAKKQELSQRFTEIGRAAATKFLTKFQALDLSRVEQRHVGGVNRFSVALDVEEKLINEGSSSRTQRQAYGRFYAMAVVAWIAEVQSKMENVQIILYTTPSVYEDYLSNAYPGAVETLHGLPIWLARTRDDGGDVTGGKKTSSEQAQRVCLTAAGNRCVIHQYSHRGTFSATGKPRRGIPPHIDLDRFFFVKEVSAGVGSLMVRR